MDTKSEYWELLTNCLISDEILPFDVYILREGRTVLWRSKSIGVEQKDIIHLTNLGVRSVIIKVDDKAKFFRYIEPKTLDLIRDETIPLYYRSQIVDETTNNILNELYKAPENMSVAKRLENIVTPIVELIVTNSNVAALKFLIGNDNKECLDAPHCSRTCYYTVALASAYKKTISTKRLNQLAHASLLHDIGKLVIKPEIREKKGTFTDAERYEMQKHPVYSVNLIRKSQMYDFDDVVLIAIKSHHELGDKTGYPKQEPLFNLPLEANIMALTHTFEAFTADKPHRKARKFYDVVRYLLSNPAKYPLDVMRKFVHILSKLETC